MSEEKEGTFEPRDVVVEGKSVWGSTFEMAICNVCGIYSEAQICYVFMADCRGDAIRLCERHFGMVYEELKRQGDGRGQRS